MSASARHRRARSWSLGLTAAAVLVGLCAATAPAVKDKITLYRIPGESGKWFHYTDRRPPQDTVYQEVGDYERTSRPVNLLAGRRNIYVYYPTGDRRKGQQICEDAWYAVRLNERIAGFAFSWPGDIKIYRVPQFEIGVAAEYRGPDGIMASGSDPYLMYHEIAHYWANTDLYSARWLGEAFAELHAYIVGRRVRGSGSSETFRDWKFKAVAEYPDPDFPLETWDFGQQSTFQRERFAYGKAFAASSLLMDQFGLHRLQEVNRRIRRQKKPANTREYIGLLESIVGVGKVDQMLSGWVLPGPYWLDGERVSLEDYLQYLRKHPPRLPVRLDPARPDMVEPWRPLPATSRPTGYFVDRHGRPIPPPAPTSRRGR